MLPHIPYEILHFQTILYAGNHGKNAIMIIRNSSESNRLKKYFFENVWKLKRTRAIEKGRHLFATKSLAETFVGEFPKKLGRVTNPIYLPFYI